LDREALGSSREVSIMSNNTSKLSSPRGEDNTPAGIGCLANNYLKSKYMSADNGLLINKETFEVLEWQGDGDNPWKIGQGKDLEEAIDIAQKYCQEEIVEYGINFI
jgi:hypothetical protein